VRRVRGRVDERKRARHAFAGYVERDAHELAGLEGERRPLDAQREQGLGPMAVLDHARRQPLVAH
jgi:hypothetical protein